MHTCTHLRTCLGSFSKTISWSEAAFVPLAIGFCCLYSSGGRSCLLRCLLCYNLHWFLLKALASRLLEVLGENPDQRILFEYAQDNNWARWPHIGATQDVKKPGGVKIRLIPVAGWLRIPLPIKPSLSSSDSAEGAHVPGIPLPA